MNEAFKALLQKKMAEGKGNMSPVDKEASDSVLADLQHFLDQMQGDKVKGLKKVTVASNDPKGLEEGLAKAKDLVAHDPMASDDSSDEDDMDMGDEDDHSMDEGASDNPHSEDSHMTSSPEMSPEDMMKQIEMLKAQLAAKGN